MFVKEKVQCNIWREFPESLREGSTPATNFDRNQACFAKMSDCGVQEEMVKGLRLTHGRGVYLKLFSPAHSDLEGYFLHHCEVSCHLSSFPFFKQKTEWIGVTGGYKNAQEWYDFC